MPSCLPAHALRLCAGPELLGRPTSVRRPAVSPLVSPQPGLVRGIAADPAASGKKARVLATWWLRHLPGPGQVLPVPWRQERGTCPSSSRERLQGYFCPRHYPSGFGG